jgi:hypothetical protein
MYLSIGILCLTLATLFGFHVGSQTVQAQTGSIVGTLSWITTNEFIVILDNGDLYSAIYNKGGTPELMDHRYIGNYWDGFPNVPTTNNTWGGIKGQYEGEGN